jgi:hypothetical protein
MKSHKKESATSEDYCCIRWYNSLSVQYVIAEIKRTPRSFFIGLFTVFLVVFFVSFLANVVGQSPLVFFKVAERTVGENDLVITPGFGIGGETVNYPQPLPLLNQSFFDVSTAHLETVSGSSPRWILLADASANVVNKSANLFILGIDSIRETAIGLGRDWTLPPLGYNEVIISRSAVRQMGLDPNTAVGSLVTMTISPSQLSSALGVESFDSSPAGLEAFLNSLAPATYIGCFADSSERDLPASLTNRISGEVGVTIETCRAAADAANLLYFGLQNGNECWGGNSYGGQGIMISKNSKE